MVKQCNIYGQSVQQIIMVKFGWFKPLSSANVYYAYIIMSNNGQSMMLTNLIAGSNIIM